MQSTPWFCSSKDLHSKHLVLLYTILRHCGAMLHRYFYAIGIGFLTLAFRAPGSTLDLGHRASSSCWAKGLRTAHSDCIDAAGLACNKTVAQGLLKRSSNTLRHSGSCGVNVVLPYGQFCNYNILKAIVDDCVPVVKWIWQQGRGGSLNMAQGVGGRMPNVLVPLNQSVPAYAVFAWDGKELDILATCRG